MAPPATDYIKVWSINQYFNTDGASGNALNDTAIEIQVETKLNDFGVPFDWKRIHTVAVDTEPSDQSGTRTMTITYIRDTVGNYGSSYTQADIKRAQWRFKGPGRCRWIGVKLNCSTTQPLEINALGFMMTPGATVGKSM